MDKKRSWRERLNLLTASIDVPLLILFCTVTYASLPVKCAGIAFIYMIRPDFRFEWRGKRLPLFYPAIAAIGLLHGILIWQQAPAHYWAALGMATVLWVAALLVMHQIRLAADKSGSLRMGRTIEFFLMLNAAVSLLAILKIMLITRTINPFMYGGMNHHYHVSTGDHIVGIFNDVSTTNSCVMLMGLVYFFYKGKYGQSILCLLIVLLTTSNINNILLLGLCTAFFVIFRSKTMRTLSLCLLGIIVFFLVSVTPNNLRYTVEKVHGEWLIGNLPTENKEVDFQNPPADENATANDNANDSIYLKIRERQLSYQLEKEKEARVKDSLFRTMQENEAKQLLQFCIRVYGDSLESCTEQASLSGKPGKFIAFAQTADYLKSGLAACVFGAGPGNFSSKTAFKASGIGVFGNYPSAYRYIHPLFKKNHLKDLTYYFIQSPDKHSVINTPYSAYNQLAGEYGLVGLALFALTYVGFYLRQFRILSWGRMLLPILLLLLVNDYWFEQLSVAVIFEALMFLDLSRQQTATESVALTKEKPTP